MNDMDMDVDLAACIACTEASDDLITVQGSAICYDCVTGMFQRAIWHEAEYPVKWGNEELNIDDFPRLHQGIKTDFKAKEKEYLCPPAERIYCKADIQSGCTAFLGKRTQTEKTKLCHNCHNPSCLACGEFIRRGRPHACKPADLVKEDEEAYKGLQRGKDYQICPSKRCGRKIQLMDGCNHITCMCGQQSCFICGEPVNMRSRHWNQRPGEQGKCPRYNQPGEANAIFDGDRAGHDLAPLFQVAEQMIEATFDRIAARHDRIAALEQPPEVPALGEWFNEFRGDRVMAPHGARRNAVAIAESDQRLEEARARLEEAEARLEEEEAHDPRDMLPPRWRENDLWFWDEDEAMTPQHDAPAHLRAFDNTPAPFEARQPNGFRPGGPDTRQRRRIHIGHRHGSNADRPVGTAGGIDPYRADFTPQQRNAPGPPNSFQDHFREEQPRHRRPGPLEPPRFASESIRSSSRAETFGRPSDTRREARSRSPRAREDRTQPGRHRRRHRSPSAARLLPTFPGGAPPPSPFEIMPPPVNTFGTRFDGPRFARVPPTPRFGDYAPAWRRVDAVEEQTAAGALAETRFGSLDEHATSGTRSSPRPGFAGRTVGRDAGDGDGRLRSNLEPYHAETQSRDRLMDDPEPPRRRRHHERRRRGHGSRADPVDLAEE